ncbi:Fe-S cluster assembly protein SufD [Caulobacter sp. 17J80-11]|uniref:Fe-S cluster assembly protein SufD n=1 Tax=Caulobacter sp. 17J80-11 TaxID=2763502 RepID=UPI001653C2E6|nr:Fe-S cluster assembly protein SufD [Caulobacter sp. 17J80-11]
MNAPVRLDLRDASTFPTRRVEDWKWSDLKRFLRDAPAVSAALAVAPGGPFAALGGREIAFGNGVTADGAAEARFEGAGTLRLRFVSEAQATGHQARATVVVPARAELLVLESYEGAGSAYASNVTLGFELGEGARLTRIVLLEEPDDAISVSAAEVKVAPHAHYTQTVLASGAKLQRHETRVNHPGHGASVRLDGLYVLSGSRHADLTTVVDHQGVEGVTSQLTKGVVADSARGVFQGRIVVDRGADKTDARMGHHALILSDKAEVDAKPELEIYADDVSCAHGNTVGALDENALFYACARGIPEHEARVMLTQAFLGEVTDRIEHDGAREAAQAWLVDRLEALL